MTAKVSHMLDSADPRTKKAAAGSTPPAEGAPLSPDTRARRLIRLIAVILLSLLALWVARDFLPALAWAAVIAIAVWPAYLWCAPDRKPGGVLAPLAFTLLCSLFILAPVAFALIEVGREGQGLVQWANQAKEQGVPLPNWVVQLPLLGSRAADWWRTNLAEPGGAAALLQRVDAAKFGEWVQAYGGQVLHRLFLVFLTFVVLFFLLRDGAWLGERILAFVDTWLGRPGERLAEKMVAAVRGTVNGTVLIALGEGAIISIGYFIAGVPHAILFGVLTAAFAMLPFGAWFAFGLAALVLLGQGGSALAAFALFCYGAGVMIIGDNFVQPALIGGTARLPFLWALIGIFGGLATFGLVGLFLGPVIMAALLTVGREWLDTGDPERVPDRMSHP